MHSDMKIYGTVKSEWIAIVTEAKNKMHSTKFNRWWIVMYTVSIGYFENNGTFVRQL